MSNLYEGEYVITSPFGPRNLHGDTRPHKGIDCVGTGNKNLVAICDGIVVSSQMILKENDKTSTWEWGNYIKINDGFGYFLHYCHLDKRLAAKGTKVSKGQKIGVEGQTGYSFGFHCHFEVRDKNNISIDPQEYFKILEKRDNKKMTVEEAKKIIKEKAKLDDNTINYLSFYKYDEALLIKLATAMI